MLCSCASTRLVRAKSAKLVTRVCGGGAGVITQCFSQKVVEVIVTGATRNMEQEEVVFHGARFWRRQQRNTVTDARVDGQSFWRKKQRKYWIHMSGGTNERKRKECERHVSNWWMKAHQGRCTRHQELTGRFGFTNQRASLTQTLDGETCPGCFARGQDGSTWTSDWPLKSVANDFPPRIDSFLERESVENCVNLQESEGFETWSVSQQMRSDQQNECLGSWLKFCAFRLKETL